MPSQKIKRLMVANRGEIAVRIFRTAKRLGIETLAIYEPAEQHALHVQVADVAVELQNSFTNIDEIVSIAKAQSVDAVHPGYGFLSENYLFAKALAEAGIAFVGPSTDAIKLMGDKNAARKVAQEAGVPMLEGLQVASDEQIDEASLIESCAKIGYPVLLKAAAGGGGKAMAVVREKTNLLAEVARIREEAHRLYQNKGLVIEKYLEQARHVEVQILGNAKRENFAISDRDCSIQRNNQKIIEEAPAPGLPDGVRKSLHAAAVSLANKVKYQNAGTVEFLYEPDSEQVYFLEMNTRLQVEHTVTEAVTGLDLVEEQLKIAASIDTQYLDIVVKGHSLEARICAEQPDQTYEPSTGELFVYEEPDDVRVDSGVSEGSQVLAQYDNMMAKVIVHSESRSTAIDKLIEALHDFHILGVATNIRLMIAVLGSEDFRSVNIHTRTLAENKIEIERFSDETLMLIGAAVVHENASRKSQDRYGELAGFDLVKVSQ